MLLLLQVLELILKVCLVVDNEKAQRKNHKSNSDIKAELLN